VEGAQGESEHVVNLDRRFREALLREETPAQAKERVGEAIGRSLFHFLYCAAKDSFLDGTPIPQDEHEQDDASDRSPLVFFNKTFLQNACAPGDLDPFLRKHESLLRGNAKLAAFGKYVRGAVGMTTKQVTQCQVREEFADVAEAQSGTCPASGMPLLGAPLKMCPKGSPVAAGSASDEDSDESGENGCGVFLATFTIDTRALRFSAATPQKTFCARDFQKQRLFLRGQASVSAAAAAMFLWNFYELAKICAAARHMDFEESPPTVSDALHRLVADKEKNYFFDSAAVYNQHSSLFPGDEL